MIDTTPIWFIAVCAIVVILLWIALELRQARKYGRQKYYNFSISNGQLNEKVQADRVDFLNPNKFPLPEEDTPMTQRQAAAEKIRQSNTYGRGGI